MFKSDNKKDAAKKYANLFFKMVLILLAVCMLSFLGMGVYVLLMDIYHNGFYFVK